MKKDFLPFALPDIGEEEINEVATCLRTGWLTTGPKTAQFEQAFSEYLQVPHSLAVNSGTSGLHLSLEAVRIVPGDKVITTPYTFTATAEVIRYLGADPVFVDIEPETFNIDPVQAEAKIISLKSEGLSLKAIIPVHFGGQACEMDSILEVARHYGLKVIEDAAHALPSTYHGNKIGTLGDVTVFSFYATKPLATGEGGMVVTNSEEIADRIKIMRLHGINRDVWDRYTSKKPNWYYEVVAPGFKYNLPDIMAAIGIHQLKKVERFQKRRKEIARRYTEAFVDLPLRTPHVVRPEDTHAWHLYVIQLELKNLNISRDDFIEKMAEKGIGTSVHFIPLHLHPYWRDRYKLSPDDYPNALHAYERAVSLPIYSKMTDADQSCVIDTVRKILKP